MGRTDRLFKIVNGAGALFNNLKEIIISDFKENSPQRITVTYLGNGKVKISLYKNQGKDEHVLCLCDDLPTAIKGFKVPDTNDRK